MTLRRVDINVTSASAKDGSSWEDAYDDLLAAISNSSNGDEIWVTSDTYSADQGNSPNSVAFAMHTKGLTIRGGFSGIETCASDRIGNAKTTIMPTEDSGDRQTMFVILNSYNYVIDSFSFYFGDGYINNTSGYSGAIVDAYNVFSSTENGNLTLIDCDFSACSGTLAGAVNFVGQNVIVSGCNFYDNVCTQEGGALNVRGYVLTEIYSNKFLRNTARHDGGGAFLDNCQGSVYSKNNLFAHNESNTHVSDSGGGALLLETGLGNPVPDIYFSNDIYYGNITQDNGGAVYFLVYGVFPGTTEGTIRIVNTLCYNNSASTSGDSFAFESAETVDINSCVLENGINSVVNLNGSNIISSSIYLDDPDWQDDYLFNETYKVKLSSPCIDSGLSQSTCAFVPSVDLEGNTRPKTVDGRISIYDGTDIGCFEIEDIDSINDPFDYENLYNVSGTVYDISDDKLTVTIDLGSNSPQNIVYPIYVSGGSLTELATSSESCSGKYIELVKLLPAHLENSETGDFVKFFEDFLNNLYYCQISDFGKNNLYDIVNGEKRYYYIETTSSGEIVYTSAGNPNKIYRRKSPTISILEKIKRLTYLHDPDLIDIEYIQRLANLMGYNIETNRENVGVFSLSSSDAEVDWDDVINDSDTKRYLRTVIQNLPNWYKIKTTDNAIKILLYSFGLVGDLIYRWTSDEIAGTRNHPTSGGYGNDRSLWFNVDREKSFTAQTSSMPSNYFPTPHFYVRILQDNTPSNWQTNLDQIIRSIESIRPINNVFDGLSILFQAPTTYVYVRQDTFNRTKDVVSWLGDETALTLLSPNGGETLTSGTSAYITWNIGYNSEIDKPADGVKIEISVDNGGTWDSIVNSATNLGGYGQYFWEVSASTSGTTNLIRLTEVDGSITGTPNDDESNTTFIINN